MKDGGEEVEGEGLKECLLHLAPRCAGLIDVSCFSPFLAVFWAELYPADLRPGREPIQ